MLRCCLQMSHRFTSLSISSSRVGHQNKHQTTLLERDLIFTIPQWLSCYSDNNLLCNLSGMTTLKPQSTQPSSTVRSNFRFMYGCKASSGIYFGHPDKTWCFTLASTGSDSVSVAISFAVTGKLSKYEHSVWFGKPVIWYWKSG